MYTQITQLTGTLIFSFFRVFKLALGERFEIFLNKRVTDYYQFKK